MPTTTANTKGSVTFKTVSPNLQFEGKSAAGNITLKHKSGDVTTSLAFSDATARNVNALQDIVLTFDYRYNSKLNFSGSYDFNINKHKLSGTWTGRVADRPATAKVTYTEKDGNVASELKYVVNGIAAQVDLNKTKLSSIKAGVHKGGLYWEPSYNFKSESPCLTVTKKNKGNSLKASYDVKSEKASLEWNKSPLKVALNTTVSTKLQPAKPNVTITYEKLYHI